MRFQVHAICLAFCQQPTVLRCPAEKIGTIDSIGLGQCGRGSAASKRSRDCSLFLVGLQQVSYLICTLQHLFLFASCSPWLEMVS